MWENFGVTYLSKNEVCDKFVFGVKIGLNTGHCDVDFWHGFEATLIIYTLLYVESPALQIRDDPADLVFCGDDVCLPLRVSIQIIIFSKLLPSQDKSCGIFKFLVNSITKNKFSANTNLDLDVYVYTTIWGLPIKTYHKKVISNMLYKCVNFCSCLVVWQSKTNEYRTCSAQFVAHAFHTWYFIHMNLTLTYITSA